MNTPTPLSDEEYARKLGEAVASPEAVIESLISELEAGEVVTSLGDLVFGHGDIAVELALDDAAGPGVINGTLWTSGADGEPVEISNVRLRIEVVR